MNKSFFTEFKEFATRGNVIDLAVGVIIGGAFGAITTSLVNDLVMPFVGLFLGGIDFSSWAFYIGPIFAGAEPTVINIGMFIQSVINFLVLAFVIFLMVRQINRIRSMAELKKKQKKIAAKEAVPELTTDQQLLSEILAQLKMRS